jgi:hypothetical protein
MPEELHLIRLFGNHSEHREIIKNGKEKTLTNSGKLVSVRKGKKQAPKSH